MGSDRDAQPVVANVALNTTEITVAFRSLFLELFMLALSPISKLFSQ